MQWFYAHMSLKPEDNYRSRFLRSIQTAKCGAVCGRVCAEKKKSTVYGVDLKLDVCGVVQKSKYQSETGMGPEAHCIHVVCRTLCISKGCRVISSETVYSEVAVISSCRNTHRLSCKNGTLKFAL